MENPIKMDDLGVPLFLETSKVTMIIPFLVGNPELNLHLPLASWVANVDIARPESRSRNLTCSRCLYILKVIHVTFFRAQIRIYIIIYIYIYSVYASPKNRFFF